MASQELSARLKYLDEAAHLLAPTASAASKHMILQYNSLLFDATDPHKPLKNKNACGACGTIMILGWEAAMEPSIPRSRRNGKSNGNGNGSKSKAISYKCQSCHRTTRYPILNRQRRKRPAPKSSSSAHTLTPISSSNLQPKTNLSASAASSANSNSKKRAKSRKQGGLQAILAKKNSTEAASSGFGLDLLDFMKK